MSEIKPNTNSLRRRDNSTIALEKFSLEETLGKGAYAKVKLAKCRDTGEKETMISVLAVNASCKVMLSVGCGKNR